MSIRTRIDKLEAGLGNDTETPFEFGRHYFTARDANPELELPRQQRREYSFQPPSLTPGEYIEAETPAMMTQAKLSELLEAINNKSRTIPPQQTQGIH